MRSLADDAVHRTAFLYRVTSFWGRSPLLPIGAGGITAPNAIFGCGEPEAANGPGPHDIRNDVEDDQLAGGTGNNTIRDGTSVK